MGSNSFLAKMVSYDPINQLSGDKLGTYLAPGVGKYRSPGSINNPSQGASPQAGVAPTLAAANQGYQVAPTGGGAPAGLSGAVYGMNPGANPSTSSNQFTTSSLNTPPASTVQNATPGAANPYVQAVAKASQNRQANGGGAW